MRIRSERHGLLVGATLFAAAVAGIGAAVAAGPDFDANAPVPLSATIPADVDPTVRDALLEKGDLLLAHRLFERQQWAAFVALNWPTDDSGAPLAAVGDDGDPAWSNWIETYQVFKPKGAEPDPWDGRHRSVPLAEAVQKPLPDDTGPVGYPELGHRDARLLHNLSSTQKLNVATETDQAFSFSVFDQYGRPAYYESLINKVEYDLIVDNKLYEAGGLANYIAKNGKLTFPAGSFEGNKPGAIEVKVAWRVLDPAMDDFSRYLTQPAYVVSGADDPTWKAVTVGLVGFHIAQKTETSPQWIWSTFEHVDNITVNRLHEITTADGTKRRLQASFNDAECEWCPVNVPVPPDENGVRRTQVTRLVPVPGETAALNDRMRAVLAEAGSKLQYYEMIGVQWPTYPDVQPQRGAAFPGSVVNVSGGEPLMQYLANSVMETFSQVGNRPADKLPRSVTTSDRMTFGTGSCMACHSASPYDFSWIMTKAQPRPAE